MVCKNLSCFHYGSFSLSGKPDQGTMGKEDPCAKQGKVYEQNDPEIYPKSAFRRLKQQMDLEARLEGDFELS